MFWKRCYLGVSFSLKINFLFSNFRLWDKKINLKFPFRKSVGSRAFIAPVISSLIFVEMFFGFLMSFRFVL